MGNAVLRVFCGFVLAAFVWVLAAAMGAPDWLALAIWPLSLFFAWKVIHLDEDT